MTGKEAENQIRELLERVPQIARTLEEQKDKLADQDDLIRKLKDDIAELVKEIDKLTFDNIRFDWTPNQIHQQWMDIRKKYSR